MNVPAAMTVWKTLAGRRDLTPFQKERLRRAVRVLKASRTSMVGNPRPTLDQATRQYMEQFADVAESGITEMTGKGRRDAGREGEFIGRFGGIKKSFPALDRLKAGPKAIAAAIRKGKGRAFNAIYQSVSAEMEREGYRPARKRSPGKPVVPGHSGNAKCVHCGNLHSKSEHRFHGPGSFHQTHLFSFPRGKRNPSENPLTMIYGRVLVVHAQKTQPHRCDAECKKKNHIYYHEFQKGAVMWGLPNGDILIRGER